MFERRALPLRDLTKPGRFGATAIEPGVQFSIQHPVSIVQVFARKGASKKFVEALSQLKAVTTMQAGPDQYFVQAADKAEGALYAEIKKKLEGIGSAVDQSHGRVAIVISGTKSRAVLAKGAPVDFHPDQFAIGQSAQTQMAHIGVHITRTDANEFSLLVFRGFSESLWEWLCSQAAEFGYQIK